VPAVISGAGWVTERTNEDGTKTVLPLVGWQVIEGELYALPRSLGADIVVRPMVESDATAIRTSAMRLRPQKTNQTDSWNQWRTNLWT
jgi:hypothetical protein